MFKSRTSCRFRSLIHSSLFSECRGINYVEMVTMMEEYLHSLIYLDVVALSKV
jgi:hypothetical protein